MPGSAVDEWMVGRPRGQKNLTGLSATRLVHAASQKANLRLTQLVQLLSDLLFGVSNAGIARMNARWPLPKEARGAFSLRLF